MRKIIPFVVFMVLAMMGCTSLDCPLNNTVYTKYKLMGDNKTLKRHANDFYEKDRRNR